MGSESTGLNWSWNLHPHRMFKMPTSGYNRRRHIGMDANAGRAHERKKSKTSRNDRPHAGRLHSQTSKTRGKVCRGAFRTHGKDNWRDYGIQPDRTQGTGRKQKDDNKKIGREDFGTLARKTGRGHADRQEKLSRKRLVGQGKIYLDRTHRRADIARQNTQESRAQIGSIYRQEGHRQTENTGK